MKKEITKESNKIVLFFTGMLVISCLIVFASYILGDNLFIFRDCGGDTQDQYYPYYVSIVTRIREGNFGFWNSHYGLGTSLLNNLSQTLDPFGILIILIGLIAGTDIIKYALVFMQIIKMFTAAFLCRKLLKCFNVSEVAACLGAYLYALNGYLMLWGQHYMLGTGSVYILLVLLCLEKVIREDSVKWRIALTISVFFTLIYSYYMAYMILLFSAIYFLIRVFYPDNNFSWMIRIKKSIGTLTSVLIGALMSGIVLIPAAGYLFNSSSRLDSDVSTIEKFISYFFSNFSNGHIGQAASRLLSNNLLYINEGKLPGWGNYYEMPNLFYTTFIYLIFAQFVILVLKKGKKHITTIIYYGCCLFAAYMILLNPGISMAFNGFAYPQGRSAFVIIPVLAIMTAYVWDECIVKRQISRMGVIAGAVFSSGTIIYSYRRAALDVKHYNIVFALCIIMFACLMIYLNYTERYKKQVMTLMLFCFALTSVLDGTITNNQRDNLKKSDFTCEGGYDQNIADTEKALKYIKNIDSSFYRVEKDYIDNVVYADPVIEGYSSVTDYNSTVNRNIRDFYKYLYSSVMPADAIRIFTLSNETDLVSMELINLKYFLSHEKKDMPGFEYLTSVGNVHIYKNINTESIAKWYTKTVSKDVCENLTEAEKKELIGTTAIIDSEKDTFTLDVNGKAEIGLFEEISSGYIEGKVSNTSEGILMLAIPDQQGWDVYVDGVWQESFNVNYGFLGIHLNEGEHSIVASYSIPYLMEGIICSLIGIGLFVGQLLFWRKKNRCSK